ncbi:methyltransferase domain-containing protein [Thioalkalivibrio sp. AKL19]|uniref:class I SAM-dependent methyltransferase n=1 Tax=Thioalkalivibrio sp. AKL19 TaxID=1266914 RepID=UPI000685BA77|nr:methyltransferase domain-containing protein [Thioalkalivibrio sp. AKL19]
MYGRRPVADAKRASRAILSNFLAKGAPGLYVRLTGETGRGKKAETPQSVADYFRTCFSDYFEKLGVGADAVDEWLEGKVLLEYGPGDVPGVGLLMLAHGAEKVICVDRFSLNQRTSFQVSVLQEILDGLEGESRRRAASCFVQEGDPASGFKPARLEYRVTRSGLSGLSEEVDLVYSRAVLEHVNDLGATFDDMARALKPDGVAIHQVDLKSHGLHRENPLDFLTWPALLWRLMYEGKGVPNRWRLNRYRQALGDSGMVALSIEPTALAEQEDINAVRPFLATPFRELDDETLQCLGFWLVATKDTDKEVEVGSV